MNLFRRLFAQVRVFYLEAMYQIHLRIRYGHDITYKNFRWYKKYSDSPISSGVHRATIWAFVISFVIFTTLQFISPNVFSPGLPNKARAATSSKTWTTNGDFAYNKTSVCGQTTQSNVVISGAAYTDNTCATAGVDSNVTMSSSGSFNNAQTSGVATDLTSVFFTDANTGYAAGLGGVIRKTTNGGTTWSALTSGTTSDFNFIYFTDANTGFAGGTAGNLRKTTNAGTSWSSVSPGTNIYYSAYFKDASNGFVTYRNSTTGQGIYKTADGGSSWTAPISGDTFTFYYGIFFTDATNGYVVGDKGNGSFARIRKSTDGGLTWGGYINSPTASTLRQVYFTDANTGYAVGDAGTIIKTTNAGTSWSALTSGTTNALRSVYFTDANTGYAVGDAGTILKTTNAGVNWGVVTSGTTNILYSVRFPTSSVGYAVGQAGTINKYIFQYNSPGSISGLKVDAGSGQKNSWSSISWILNAALPTNTAVSFQTRGTNIAAPDGSTPINQSSPDNGWTTFTSLTGVTNSDSTHYSGSVATTGTRWLEIKVSLTSSDGLNTPTLNDFTLSYDTLEAPINSNTTLKKIDGTSLISSAGNAVGSGVIGGFTNETSIKVAATGLTCTGCAGTLTGRKIEVEYKPTGTAFDGTGTVVGDSVDAGGGNYTSTATITGLSGSSYHLRMRAIDDAGRSSAWTSYGTSPEDVNEADFTVDQTAPTISSVSINSGQSYTPTTSTTVSINAASDSGSKLSKLYLANKPTSGDIVWVDKTPVSNFVGQTTYTGDVSGWDLITGDGTKTVYAKVVDNAGNTSGTWYQSSQADYSSSGNVTNNTQISLPGDVRLGWQATTTNYSIATGNDDAKSSVCSYIRDGVFINVGYDCVGDGSDYTVGLFRWALNIPKNATIQSAKLKVVPTTNVPAGGYMNINLIDSDNMPSFINNPTPYYSAGLAAYAFPTSQSFTQGVTAESGDIKSLVQTFVNRAGYNPGNYIGLDLATNGGVYNLATFENTTYTEPILEVTYLGSTYSSSGDYTSAVKDNGSAQNYGKIYWSSNIPSQAGANALRFQIASNDDNSTWNYIGPDGTASTYYTTSGTQISSDHNNHRYIRYKAYLQTGNTSYTPVVNDVAIEILTTNSDSIILDTTPPANVTNLKAYEDSSKLNELATSDWHSVTTPYFEWTANTDPDLAGYKYCLSTDSNCTPITDLGNTNNYTVSPALSTIAQYYFKVVAYDGAGHDSATPTSFIYKFDNAIPGAVTGLSASNNNLSTIALTWNPVDTTGSAPVENYKLERVKESVYVNNVWNLNSVWSSGEGYASFILTGTTFTDDSNSPAQGQTAIETSVKYIYRIRVKDTANSNYSAPQASPVYGLTRDAIAPSDPTNVVATACDGTLTYCSDVANKGFEIKITWNPSSDSGTGVAKYNIYRASSAPDNPASFVKVSEVTAPNVTFFDNDAAHVSDPTNKLNDYSTYYYRVTAVDNASPANESALLPAFDPTLNTDSATTPDVTAPSIPTELTTTPMGLDPSGTRQRIALAWSASTDQKARSSEAGSGVKEYKIYRSGSESGTYSQIGTTSDLTYNDDNLDEFTYYYYKVLAIDNTTPANESALSTFSSARTASNAVPTVPTNVVVTSKKGNPATDSEVGDKITISFKGSYSKNCLNNERCLVNYEVYRSTTNYSLASDWLNPAKAVKIANVSPSRNDDDRDNVYSVSDTGLTDATTYYYKVRAIDNTPTVPDGGPFQSALSAISVGTLNTGWDITPDTTKPQLPAGGLEVQVRDTHPNELELRNIVTWKMLTDSELPTRNGVSDFAKYEVHREVIDPTDGHVISDTDVADVTNLGDNYYIDIIPIALVDTKFKYYVTIVDNAGTDFKYSNNTVINPGYPNSSDKAYWSDSIIPSKSKPALSGSVTLSNVNVSSAEVTWTTDQDSDSLVQFKEKGQTDWIALGQIEKTTNHDVKLFGLKPLTEYDYQLVSRNYLGNNVEYDPATLPPLKTAGFNITFGSADATTSTAEITWSTNLDASSAFIEYQLQRQPGDDPQGGTAGVEPSELATSPKNHLVIVKGLRSNRTYTYKIKSISTDGFVAETEFLTFKTRSFDSSQFTLAPSSSNVAERNITATTALIAWQTGQQTTSWVDYSTKSGIYDMSAGNNDLTTSHAVQLEGLVPGTTYYYRVRVKDANEVEFTSQEYSFTAVLKPKISNMQIKDIKPYEVTISWDTNVDTETLINWGKSATYGEKKGTQGTSKVHELKITNLEDNTEYHYQILAHDEAGNEVADEDRMVRTPLDTEGPKIESVKTDILPIGTDEATATVIVSWQTNKPATTLVEYDEGILGGRYTKQSVEDKTLNNSHTVIIKDLNPASSYHFKIVSKDKRGNIGTSPDHTFVTPSKEKSILQLILKSLEDTFAWTRNIGKFFSNIGNRIKGK